MVFWSQQHLRPHSLNHQDLPLEALRKRHQSFLDNDLKISCHSNSVIKRHNKDLGCLKKKGSILIKVCSVNKLGA